MSKVLIARGYPGLRNVNLIRGRTTSPPVKLRGLNSINESDSWDDSYKEVLFLRKSFMA